MRVAAAAAGKAAGSGLAAAAGSAGRVAASGAAGAAAGAAGGAAAAAEEAVDPFLLRVYMELPVGARYGQSGSKMEQFSVFCFSSDPLLQWLAVASRKGLVGLLFLI